jgi:hypothetical protein
MKRGIALIVLVFALRLAFGQASSACDSIYASPETRPIYKPGDKALNDYVNKKLIPLLDDCPQRRGENELGHIVVTLTVDRNGKIIEAAFPALKISAACKKSFRDELLSMTGWKPGENKGKSVCSKYVLKFTVYEIDKGLGTD